MGFPPGVNATGGIGFPPGTKAMGGMGFPPGINATGGMGFPPGTKAKGGMGFPPGVNVMDTIALPLSAMLAVATRSIVESTRLNARASFFTLNLLLVVFLLRLPRRAESFVEEKRV
jgi:hypothetical protein